MSDQYKTPQEVFWASEEWGNDYMLRNNTPKIKNYINLFSKILSRCDGEIKSVIEFGANIGLNLHAINELTNGIDISAVEINKNSVIELNKLDFIKNVYNESILDIDLEGKRDFVFTKGMLIHINPEYLDIVYEKMYESSKKYIMLAEYYNPTPVTVSYRGRNNQLFKRDFAGEMLDKYPDLTLVDYGFTYHRDNNFPLDDSTWFLLKKN
ncbi:MAG: pseudaminic acid biosynthesis-associated methylase [Paracoccaceae bacterium]